MSDFVHLRLHTEYSVVDSTLRIDEALAATAQDGQGALALTDLNNLFAGVKFYKAARGKGIKPLLGAEVTVEGSPLPSTGLPVQSRLLLLVQNQQGYLNLCELLARSWTQSVNPLGAALGWDSLAELSAGLIVLSGADAGLVGQALLAEDDARAAELALAMAQCFPHRFYLEVQRAGRPMDELHTTACARLAARLKLPLVATQPVQFLQESDFDAHETRVCIADGELVGNPQRIRRFSPEQYLKTRAQMQALFADLPSALANTVEIAKRCSVTLNLGQSRLPDYPVPPVDGRHMGEEEYFRYAAFAGLSERLVQLYPKEAEREAKRASYEERLSFELETIIKMKFPGYFLIVSDFIQWAKMHDCPVGPGRGSGAGSLVAYVLKITDLDPLQYGLLFERFLNPERVSMPDFDIDFCQSNRDRVIDYVKDKYGRNAVSQIATFGTMAARGVIRDVGRALEMSFGFCNDITKLIPNKPGLNVTLAKPPAVKKEGDKYTYASEAEPELAEREAKEEQVQALMAMARKLEGLTRNIGMHAGGVLIAPGKLTDFCPLYQQPGSDSAVSQFDKDDVEAAGLVKFDFLGLATLTILEIARQHICRRHQGMENFAYEQLPLTDKKVYSEVFSAGLTEAVFQFESAGMQKLLKQAQPDRFEDLIALNALYRPGPMDNIPDFIAGKRDPAAVHYPHPLLENMLRETYGIMVYQEQVMQAAQILGGYSLGGADMLRRAMGKKKAEEMAEHRAIFRAGAAKNAIAEQRADEIFDLMEKFAGYGFNKSHAAAYSLLAYHTAWLKTHYPAEFYCGNMTVEMGNTDKLQVLVEDATRRFGISFELPDINRGEYAFVPVSDRVVRYGLGAIKGTGAQAIEAIVRERQTGGNYRSFFDFMGRLDRSKVNRRTVDALVNAGAFDSLHLCRASILASVEMGMGHAAAQEAHANQGGLFDFDDDTEAASSFALDLVPSKPWDLQQKLAQEKTALGFHLSGHLFDAYALEVRQFSATRISDLADSREPVTIAGMVRSKRYINTARGKLLVVVLDDKSASMEVSLPQKNQADDELGDGIAEDELLVVQGSCRFDKFSDGLRFSAKQTFDLPAARAHFGKYLRIYSPGAPQRLPDVARLLREFPPRSSMGDDGYEVQLGLPLRFAIDAQGCKGLVQLPSQYRFWPSDAALAAWMLEVEGAQTQLIYREPA
jgi:DNA polymerase-3 subunit alpha